MLQFFPLKHKQAHTQKHTPPVPCPSSSLHSHVSSLYDLGFGRAAHVSVQLFRPVLLITTRQAAVNSGQPLRGSSSVRLEPKYGDETVFM